jgi:hypothetical protein
MTKDLTSSPRDRQNILNNRYAIEKIEEHLGLGGIYYEEELGNVQLLRTPSP